MRLPSLAHMTTPCSQSQIGQKNYLGKRRTAEVTTVVVLSVVVRLGPVMTAVNGTLVARPVRLTRHTVVPLAPHLDRRVRPVLGDHCIVGKPRTRRGRLLGAAVVARSASGKPIQWRGVGPTSSCARRCA
jgi:hypothetical protein